MPIRIQHELRELASALEAAWPGKLAELRASGVPLNAYDNLISRTDAGALIPEEVSQTFLKGLENNSAALNRFTRVPVGSNQTRFPVLSALPVAYWVTGDTGVKQTSEIAWANKFLNIEEIAVIVPIPENVLDDAKFPIWDEVRPLCEQAAGRLLDATVFFGTNAPATFPSNVVAAATAAGNTVARGTNATAALGGYVQDIGDLLGKVETDGYDPFSGIANRTLRGFARKARDADGNRYDEVTITKDRVDIDAVEFTFPMRGQWPSGSGVAEAILFDPTEYVIGVRKDFTWKLLDQAVIQDSTGAIVYNLAQQDMVALRMTMRVGWQVANTINYDRPTESERYPAGILLTP
ncbi:MAG TPA: phage major capsid protein [Solirubrobacteraceae bacterium]|nr:phage major capsid protein [Solirubrobacteraceae bacterium]